jgi:hypothetical protein
LISQRIGCSWTRSRRQSIPGVVTAYASTVDSLQRAFEAAGVEFTNGDQPDVGLKAATAKSIPIDKLNASNDD